MGDTAKELAMWKKVVKGALGDVVYGTIEKVVQRELAKEGQP